MQRSWDFVTREAISLVNFEDRQHLIQEKS